MLLHHDGVGWGGAGLMRSPTSPEFSAEERLCAVDRGHGRLPAVVGAVASTAVGRTVAQRARTAGDSRVVLRGAPLTPGRAAITIETAGPPEVTPLISAALGLTGREIDVVNEVMRGSSTKEIAAGLHLSPYTVQDHLKSIFAKAGVNSRRQLVAGVSFGIYAPRLGSPGGPDVFFTPGSGC